MSRDKILSNSDVAEILYRMAVLSQFVGENAFVTRAYQKAARNIENLDSDIRQVAVNGRLRTIPGVGSAIAGTITEILKTGTCERYEEMKSVVPADIFRMLGVSGIGPKTVRLVHENLGITTLDELEKAAIGHRLQQLPGMGAKQEKKILRAIRRSKGIDRRIPLGVATPIA
ncbi:MAG: helix-hairpin-helix domain-containing protein, partial [Euryarchaeota archaeon]|nr:helix-hairpin-helix domain-containing protein [Euryarchaeota archaeon]